MIAIGKLSICIWTDEESLGPDISNSFRDLIDDRQNWDWPGAVPPVTYEDFLGLYEPEPMYVATIQLMSNTEFRDQVEYYSRRLGSMELPPDLEPVFARFVRQASLSRAFWRRAA